MEEPNEMQRAENEAAKAEAQMRRRERFIAVSDLPLDYRTHLILISPNGTVTVQHDNFAPWELLGLLEMCKDAIKHRANEQQVDLPDDDPQRPF